MNEIIQLLNQYGYIILFLSLMLELIILPIPNEALMSYVGVLCYKGELNLILSILFAGLGGIAGASVSYWIGYKLGIPFFRKFGHYIHMGPEKMEKMSKWYGKYGKVLLLVSYFIPGVRHIASIITGVIRLPFRAFCIFSYIGVFLWVGTFIYLGNIFGPQWEQYEEEMKKWLVLLIIVIGFLAIVYFLIKTNRQYMKESITLLYQATFKKIRSFLKLKFIILFILILFLGFFTLMIGLIQGFISNEFGEFNEIMKTIVDSLFNSKWNWIMNAIYMLSSWTALGVVAILTVMIILINKKNKWLELIFFFSSIVGVFLFSKGISWLFQYFFTKVHTGSDFPNSGVMLLVAVFGFFMYTLIRHRKDFTYSGLLFFLFLFLLVCYFISAIYIKQLRPSDLVAGYVFSAVWVTGMIFSLEMFRLLSLLKNEWSEKK